MRFVTYNVNSLSTRLSRVITLLDEHKPDVVCLQETKCSPAAFPHDELADAGYVAADHSGGRWAGVAVLARAEHGVSDVVAGLAGQPDGNEARWVEATVGGVRVVSTYGFGLRIDLAMLSPHLSKGLRAGEVQRPYRKPTKVPGTKPSDHAPLLVDVDV